VPGATRFTDALLLRSVDYGEADRVVTLLTAEHGKVALLARGARRSRRRFAGALEPYVLFRAEVGAGRGELGRLAQAQVVRPFVRILGSLRKMLLAGAGLELLRDAVPPREPDPRVFEVAVGLLEALDGDAEAREELLLAFQARLMALVGFSPGLDTCARCGRRAAGGQAARFDPARGAVVCRGCGGGPILLSGDARARLQSCIGRGWADQPPWSERQRAQVRAALDALITRHLGRTPSPARPS
jgi:DNA repair protein RecO (recombination protein O)